MTNEYLDDEELGLWNPSTKVFKTLPRPLRPMPTSKEYPSFYQERFFGLGLGPNKTTTHDDDYKVIRLLQFRYEYIRKLDYGFLGNYLVEMYSLKTDSWKSITYPHADNTSLSPDPDSTFYMNGFNYWTACTSTCTDTGDEDHVIISFDFANECFPSALIPVPIKSNYKWNCFLLAEFEESLALVVCDKHDKLLELWVWNKDVDDESWSRRSECGQLLMLKPHSHS